MSEHTCPSCGASVSKIVVRGGSGSEVRPCGCRPTADLFNELSENVTV